MRLSSLLSETLLIGLLVNAAGTSSGQQRSPDAVDRTGTDGLSLEIRVVGVTYCDQGRETADILQLGMEATVTNHRNRSVILAKTPGPIRGHAVARVLEDGTRGEDVLSLEYLEVYTLAQAAKLPKLRALEEPDLEHFAMIRPGGKHTLSVTFLLEVSRVSPSRSWLHLSPGTDYFLQLYLSLWPYRVTSPSVLEIVRKDWQPYGDLIESTLASDYTRFSVPPLSAERPASCPTR
jgi:hypothetical protein